MTGFLDDFVLSSLSWQAFERLVSRLLVAEGCEYVSVVGRSGDGGADVVAIKSGRRWLYQVKRWATPVGPEAISRTIAASRTYNADIAVIVSKNGFTASARNQRSTLALEGLNVQLWDRDALLRRSDRLPAEPVATRTPERYTPKEYQEPAIQAIVHRWDHDHSASGLVILATGLGKTFVAGEALRRITALRGGLRFIVIAHTNDLVYQLERSLWPFLTKAQSTTVVNGIERPGWTDLGRYDGIFATRDSIASAADAKIALPTFDVVIVDEAHHIGSPTYERALEAVGVTQPGGPFCLGLTATPWRPDGTSLLDRLEPVASIDLVQALRRGFLSNVDYRIFTDNVDWESLRTLRGARFTPRAINRTLFINQWDDSVVEQTRLAWGELDGKGRAIVFCGTIEHAEKMADRINALGFTNAAAIYSRASSGEVMPPVERNRLLWDFADGRIGILCSVDVLNEGVDVPDVNLIVFQRVTHSRRIFIQQLGRGLRIAPGKDRVIVLDFVTDIRRFAAGLELQRGLQDEGGPAPGRPVRLNLHSSVSFRRANVSDRDGASFLREWIGDLDQVEQAGEDVSVLRFPPIDRAPHS